GYASTHLAPPDPQFSRLVSLACHDLRRPLATVQGFAKTLLRMDVEPDQRARYLGMIDAASVELAAILDELSLAARIEGDRYEPVAREADSLELARAAAARVPGVSALGAGAVAELDADGVEAALAALARAALRQGLIESAELRVDGLAIAVSPVEAAVAPILLGAELRDFGAAVATRVVRAGGGAVEVVDGAVV